MTALLLNHRRNILWFAAMVHRLSGIGLAAFLPLHFLVLGMAIGNGENLEGFLRWTDAPLVKFAETGLVFLLLVHMLGGLRLLLVENFSWRDGQKLMALAATVMSALVAFAFLIRVF
ncbi:succinate dehydrogenase, cytochrome b556 subunit [Microvirga arabica]|uniref:succinate dehydrogenase, cytochrome b556 subunit n=1 Tax=Microvirga arabica TaxID=1128671 RepID=UPI00193A9794|nr:succinate dehydrogenase, cytochrome b subunit [Microvirga arabica]MBM1173581.1 succinate dehydrogenase, cytochrome b subunit [Microvirga arabica]